MLMSFLYLIMENGVFGKIQKALNTKRASILKQNCKIFYIKISPVTTQGLNFVLGCLI